MPKAERRRWMKRNLSRDPGTPASVTKAHDYSYPVFNMPKAERRRWIELYLSRHPETPAFLPKSQTKNRKRTKYRKSASFKDGEVVPFAPYESQSYDHLMEEDQLLLWPRQNSYFDDHDVDSGSEDSADWDWEDNMADDIDEANPTTSLFGASQWTSTWPSKTVMGIMDAVNVHLEGLYPATEYADQLPGSLCADDNLKITTPNQPRNILPEHEKLAINTARHTSDLTPQCAAHVVKNTLHDGRGSRLSLFTEPESLWTPLLPAGPPTFANPTPTLRSAHQANHVTSRPGKNLALQLYEPENVNFDELEISWRAWHKRIEEIQINLISVGNMREALTDGGRMLLALKEGVDHHHEIWQPKAILVESVRAQTATHYVVETTFNEETKLHELPKVTMASMARDGKVLRQVEKQNNGYKKFEEDFDKVLISLRYAQVQFRNLQFKLEHALAVEVLLLRQAIWLHEDLETQWVESILGEASAPVPQALSNEQPKCFCRDFDPLPLGSPASTGYDSALSALSRSSPSSSFDTTHSILSAGERQSMGTTIISLVEVFSKGSCVSDVPLTTRQKCSITTEVAAKVIKDTSGDIEDATEAIARAKRLHNFGRVEFENARKIHRDIMLSIAEKTDERTGLGKFVRLLRWCYAR